MRPPGGSSLKNKEDEEATAKTAANRAVTEFSERFQGHRIGLLIADATCRRLIEGAATNLGLQPVSLTGEDSAESLATFEMVIADEPAARELRQRLAPLRQADPQSGPALVTIVSSLEERLQMQKISALEGILLVPEKPAIVAAQLSVALYSARAFRQQYESVLDELRLNRQIFQSVTSGITIADATAPDMPLRYVNPGFELMTGYSLEEVQDRNCRFLQGDDHDQPGLKLVRDALANQRETVALLRNYRKDGTPFWNELYLSPIRTRGGEVTHFVGIQMDVTERVEFEAALRSSEKLAAVGRLASTIAHEINNPLEAVMNLVYLARTSEESSEIRHYLALADQELRRVKLITSQSLRFYKQSSRPQAIAPADLLSSVLDMYGSRLTNVGVRLQRRDRSETQIVCLESEIRQVLSNLLSNAVDAMRGTGGELLVRSRAATHWVSGVPGVVFTVADTGGGMDAETRARIYEAFFTTKEGAGTGLGLWITRGIVDRHRGSLQVRSRQGAEHSGTVFRLFLPTQAMVA